MDSNPIYRDVRHSIDVRADDLLGRMTLDEKLAQLGGTWSTGLMGDGGSLNETRAREKLQHGIGHVTRIGGASVLRPHETAALCNEIQRFLRQHTRLGIPAIVHEESCAGYLARDATCFPQAIGMAATWSPDLVEAVGQVIRDQMRASGSHQTLAPVLDIARDARWGRTEETFGEDPYLVAQLGMAYIRGVQGPDLRRGIVATAKHFLGYSATEGGMNWAPSHLGRRELLEVYAAPFAAAIHGAHVASVMNSYSEIDGVPVGASKEILDDLLRGTLGFTGVVVSDYFTIATLAQYHRVAADESEAARMGLEAGIDIELPALHCYGSPLRAAIEAGRVPMELVDRSVRRVLQMKFDLGLFDDPYVDPKLAPALFGTPEDLCLARHVAQKSLVLLKNDGEILPLQKDVGPIAILGPHASSVRLLQGDYHYPSHLEIMFGEITEGDMSPRPAGQINLGMHFPPTVTIADAIRAAVGAATEVRVARGCDVVDPSTAGFAEAAAAARGAQVAVVVLGEKSGLSQGCTSGESVDRAELGFSGVQQQFLEAVVATGTPTVLVVVSGRPLALPWAAEHVAAILYSWVPGQEGGSAIAEALFGDTEPGGRLPISLPRNVGQVPVFYGHKPSGGRSHWKGKYADSPSEPLYAFGHGLGYTRFEYSDLQASPTRVRADGELSIGVTVRNTGKRTGDEIVQLYLHDVVATVTRPVMELKGSARVTLKPEESKRVTFGVALSQMAFLGRHGRWIIEPGTLEVMVGSSSVDVRLRGEVEIDGGPQEVDPYAVFTTRIEVA